MNRSVPLQTMWSVEVGREIVKEIQRGKGRAKYGDKVIEDLSAKLTERYGKGFYRPVLWSFRQFYLTYSGRAKILFPVGRELADIEKIFPTGRELTPIKIQYPPGAKSQAAPIPHPLGVVFRMASKLNPLGAELALVGKVGSGLEI